MSIPEIQRRVTRIACLYPITSIVLFGSRATGNEQEDGDVDVIHGPMQENDLLEIGETVELYAAQGYDR